MSTNVLSVKDIKRNWHLIDAQNQILGRLATKAATLLSGKNKREFVPYLDIGDYVIVINASKVAVSGKKKQQKKYVNHSGYPDGLRVESFGKLQARQPEKIVRHAIAGMLPKTKLGKKMIKKLHVFAGEEHKFKKQVKGEEEEKA